LWRGEEKRSGAETREHRLAKPTAKTDAKTDAKQAVKIGVKRIELGRSSKLAIV
jgi:hypothetical protein